MSEDAKNIERYLRGEMSPAEMHALERKALSDPFLADALEGAGSVSRDDFTADVESLKPVSRRPIFTPLRIAAAVVILSASGLLTLYLWPGDQQSTLTSNEVQRQGPSAVDSAKQSTSEPKKADQLLSLNKEEQPATEDQSARARSEETPKATGGVAETERREELVVPESQEKNVAEEELVQRDSIAPSVSPTVAQAAPLKDAAATSGAAARKANTDDVHPANRVNGFVNLASDGIALPGVNVMVKGSDKGTVTDMNGYFSLDVAEPKPVLVFSFIGMETKEVQAGAQGPVSVAMTEDVSQLSEIVVTGRKPYTDPNAEPVIKLAEPAGGIKAYDNYLEANLRYPQAAIENNVKGKVTVEFIVGIDGTLDQFKVTRSLGFGCDEEVLRLVKEGPGWSPSTENAVPVESIVHVRMKFDPKKAKK